MIGINVENLKVIGCKPFEKSCVPRAKTLFREKRI